MLIFLSFDVASYAIQRPFMSLEMRGGYATHLASDEMHHRIKPKKKTFDAGAVQVQQLSNQ